MILKEVRDLTQCKCKLALTSCSTSQMMFRRKIPLVKVIYLDSRLSRLKNSRLFLQINHSCSQKICIIGLCASEF